jgi:hypothetical protein
MAGLLFATSLDIYSRRSQLLMVSVYTLPLNRNYAEIKQDSECQNAQEFVLVCIRSVRTVSEEQLRVSCGSSVHQGELQCKHLSLFGM